MAPARSRKGKQSTSSNNLLLPKSGNAVDMASAVVEINKLETQDDKTEIQEPWFEDKLPGNGKPENTFSDLYTSKPSLESELETSKNKSWFELVEDDEADEAEIQTQSSNFTSTQKKSQAKQPESRNALLNNQIKGDVADDNEEKGNYLNGVNCQKTHQNDKKGEKHKSIEQIPSPSIECPNKKKEETPYANKGQRKSARNTTKKDKLLLETIVIKQEKIDDTLQRLETTGNAKQTIDQQKPERKSIKEEKGGDKIPTKRERQTNSVETSGKKIKHEPHDDLSTVPSTVKTKQTASNNTDDTRVKGVKKGKVMKDTNEKCCNVEEARIDTSIEKRKRTSRSSSGSLPVKRERNASSSSSSNSSNSSVSIKKEYERDPATLSRRQKQIDYGKNTVGYDRYRLQIPKEMRTSRHPRTPPKHLKYSRRGWDGTVKIWRQQLHVWDPDADSDMFDESMLDISGDISSVTSEDIHSDQQSGERSRFSTPSPVGSDQDDAYLDIDIGDEIYFDT